MRSTGERRAFFLARQLMRLCYEVHRLARSRADERLRAPLPRPRRLQELPAARAYSPSRRWYALNATLVDELDEQPLAAHEADGGGGEQRHCATSSCRPR